jgi:hypothetical protein
MLAKCWHRSQDEQLSTVASEGVALLGHPKINIQLIQLRKMCSFLEYVLQ